MKDLGAGLRNKIPSNYTERLQFFVQFYDS